MVRQIRTPMTIIVFILARLWEDEMAALTCAGDRRAARQLREAVSKRHIVAMSVLLSHGDLTDPMLMFVAHAWEDHLDFQQQWAIQSQAHRTPR